MPISLPSAATAVPRRSARSRSPLPWRARTKPPTPPASRRASARTARTSRSPRPGPASPGRPRPVAEPNRRRRRSARSSTPTQAVTSGSVAQVTITRQDGSTLRPFGTAGLLERNTFSQPSSTEGVVLSVNTAGTIGLQWNTGGRPFVNQTRLIAAHAQLPVTLRLTRSGTSYAGDYSTDGGRTWSSAGTADVAASASAALQDVGVFHASGV